VTAVQAFPKDLERSVLDSAVDLALRRGTTVPGTLAAAVIAYHPMRIPRFHVVSDANGIPLVTGVTAANTHDSVMLQPMVESIPRVRSVRGPRRGKPLELRADKGYDFDVHRRWLRARGIVPRIARRGIEDPTRLGRHRWKIERTIAWLTGYRRLTIRYERHGRLFAAFLQLAAALTCYKKLPT
jgi:IS5 family transposase